MSQAAPVKPRDLAGFQLLEPGKHDMFVVEHRDGDEAVVHLIKMPGHSDKGWYTSLGTINAFRQREQVRGSEFIRKHGYGAKNPRYFRMYFPDDLLGEEEIFGAMGIPLHAHLPTAIHESPYAFYAAIGFDYKKNRYLK
jgi:hypothetical protein